MKFRTEIEITSLGVKIGYENRVLALGSCFAAHIARKLAGAKFRVAENPSGILFNPLSIAAAIRSYADPAPVTRGELGFDGEVWHHFGFHGDFSAPPGDEGSPSERSPLAAATSGESLSTLIRSSPGSCPSAAGSCARSARQPSRQVIAKIHFFIRSILCLRRPRYDIFSKPGRRSPINAYL